MKTEAMERLAENIRKRAENDLVEMIKENSFATAGEAIALDDAIKWYFTTEELVKIIARDRTQIANKPDVCKEDIANLEGVESTRE